MGARFDQLEQRFETRMRTFEAQQGTRFDTINRRLDALDTRVGSVERRLQDIDQSIRNLTGQMETQGADLNTVKEDIKNHGVQIETLKQLVLEHGRLRQADNQLLNVLRDQMTLLEQQANTLDTTIRTLTNQVASANRCIAKWTISQSRVRSGLFRPISNANIDDRSSIILFQVRALLNYLLSRFPMGHGQTNS